MDNLKSSVIRTVGGTSNSNRGSEGFLEDRIADLSSKVKSSQAQRSKNHSRLSLLEKKIVINNALRAHL